MSKHYDTETKRQMIFECRKSGMSDQRWCAEHGISTTTFYRWIKYFQAQACETIPDKKLIPTPAQDVVKLEVIPDMHCQKRDYFTSVSSEAETKQHYFTPTISLEVCGSVIHLSNDANPELVAALLGIMGGGV